MAFQRYPDGRRFLTRAREDNVTIELGVDAVLEFPASCSQSEVFRGLAVLENLVNDVGISFGVKSRRLFGIMEALCGIGEAVV